MNNVPVWEAARKEIAKAVRSPYGMQLPMYSCMYRNPELGNTATKTAAATAAAAKQQQQQQYDRAIQSSLS